MFGSYNCKIFVKPMESKILSRQIILVVVLLAFIMSVSLLLFRFINKSYSILSMENTPNLVKQKQINPVLPVRLKIPNINVDSSFEYVGVTPQGAMDVPKSPADVAWFELGPRPGDTGTAVIAGHYGWKNGISAVFDNLYKLKKGDKIYVENDKGSTTAFIVSGFRMYGDNENPSNVFASTDGLAHLNLITCQGIWNKTKKSYSERLVIFTDKEI